MTLSTFSQKYLSLGIFFIAFLGLQLIIWNNVVITDGLLWERRIDSMSQDLIEGVTFDLRKYSGHPGTTILLTGSAFKYVGASNAVALRLGLSVLMAAILTAIVETIRRYDRHPLWPYVAGSVLALHPLLAQSSPTNAVSGALLVLVVLMTLQFEMKKPLTRTHVATLGVALGALVATRFATGGLLSILVAGYLLYKRKSFSSLPTLVIVSLLTFFILDPLLWQAPIEHIEYLFGRANLHLRAAESTSLTLRRFVMFSPFALLGIAFAILHLLFPRRLKTPLPLTWLTFASLVTAIFSAIFLLARTQSLRYFYPLIFLWEALLPLFILHLAMSIQFPVQPAQQARAKQIMQYLIVALLIGGQFVLLVYTLTLPKWIVVQEVFPNLVQ